ncbi:hypothetical protein TNCV_766331 [Trichonephila clavipes]|nr:hypothetical protein TNCV_766331 [Trichonephila clavipes]
MLSERDCQPGNSEKSDLMGLSMSLHPSPVNTNPTDERHKLVEHDAWSTINDVPKQACRMNRSRCCDGTDRRNDGETPGALRFWSRHRLLNQFIHFIRFCYPEKRSLMKWNENERRQP